MSDSILQGIISFVNHEKKYVLIEYWQNSKKKSVRGSIDKKLQQKLKAERLIKKTHHFHIGDTVNFIIKISGKGDRMMALNIAYLYNTALDVLINKANTNNNFTGYLKIADGKYFVKEIDSYLFFPVPFSPWQIMPAENDLNEAVTFSLDNLLKKDSIKASLHNKRFIPEYHSAVKAFKTQKPVNAEIIKITLHAIYIALFGNKILAKLPVGTENKIEEIKLQTGDHISVMITYLSESKIVAERIQNNNQ